MKYFLGIFLYFIIALAIMQNWIFLALLCVLIFSFKFSPTPLIFLAIMLDAYYGAFYSLPALSIVAVIWFAIVEYVSPRLMALHS